MSHKKILHIVSTRLFTTLGLEHDVEWLKKRLLLFKYFTFNSLSKQTNQNFFWILLISQDIPDVIYLEIMDMIKPFSNFLAVKLSVADLHDQPEYQIVFNNFTKNNNISFDFLLSSRIDGDDAWSIDYVDKLQTKAEKLSLEYDSWKNYNGLMMTFKYGNVLYPFNIRGKHGIGIWKRKFFSQSVDTLTKYNNYETLYKFPHSKSIKYAKNNNYKIIIHKSINPKWLYVQHTQNDGLLRKWHRWFILFEKLYMRIRPINNRDLSQFGLSILDINQFNDKYLR